MEVILLYAFKYQLNDVHVKSSDSVQQCGAVAALCRGTGGETAHTAVVLNQLLIRK